jgi:hypothetical protein
MNIIMNVGFEVLTVVTMKQPSLFLGSPLLDLAFDPEDGSSVFL